MTRHSSGPDRRAHPRRAGAGILVAALLAAVPCPAVTWFGLVDTGELFASSDAGASWTVRSALPADDAVALAAGTSSSQLHLASRSGSIHLSTDAGLTWTAVGTVTASDVVDLVARPDLSLLALTASGAVMRSTDGGATFAAIATLPASDFVSIARHPVSGTHFAITATGSVYGSVDTGSTWNATGSIPVADAIAVRATTASLLVLSSAGDTYRSTDAGVSWIAVGTLSQVGTAALAVDGAQVFAATTDGEVATSADGTAWTWQGTMNQRRVTALATDATTATGVDIAVLPPLRVEGLFPNPTRGDAAFSIAFQLTRPELVSLELIDVAGRRVDSAAAAWLPAGPSRLQWSPRGIVPGLYQVRAVTASGAAASAKWTRLR